MSFFHDITNKEVLVEPPGSGFLPSLSNPQQQASSLFGPGLEISHLPSPCILADAKSPYLTDKNPASFSISEKLQILCKLERVDRILEEVSKRKPTADRCGFTREEAQVLKSILEDPFYHGPHIDQPILNAFFSAEARIQLLCSYLNTQSVSLDRITPVVEMELMQVLEKLSKFQITPLSFDGASSAEQALIPAQYNTGEPIDPYIAKFDTSVPHTIPVGEYLDVRLSRTICKVMRVFNRMARNTEVFIGDTKDLKKYYASQGYKGITQLGTNNSNKYYVVEHPDPRLNKLVIAGIANKSRFNNVLLQLKYKDVDLGTQVAVRGTVRAALETNTRALQTELKEFDPPPYLAFVGNRTMVLIELANRLYPDEMSKAQSPTDKEKKAEALLSANNNLKTVEVGGVFKFSYMTAVIDGEERGIIGFRMPNGSLSYDATQALIDAGVKRIVTVGAGGSLIEELGVSSYQIISESQYQDQKVALPPSGIMPIAIPSIKVASSCKNRTVDSPLEEHQGWFHDVKASATTSVDVETFHILKAIQDSEADDVQYLPGIFTSDVVGAHPLVDKISLENAYPGLPGLIQGTFDHLKVPKA
ncbi:MAG: hypothetical protein KF898_08405 [Parachlamydiales bacterium]|nr:hypothetical protein [Candidatus Acheromyda pituitae]